MSQHKTAGKPAYTLKQAIDQYGAESSLLRHLNRNEVLRFLRDSGDAHGISAIAKETGLSRPTVAVALGDLGDRGLVTEAMQGPGSPRGGRPARVFRFNGRAGAVAAVTVNHGEVTVLVADLAKQVIGETRRQSPDINREQDPVGFVVAAVTDCLDEHKLGLDQLHAVVAGVRGVVDGEGVIKTSGDLPSFVGPEVQRDLQKRFGCPVVVENDANLATLAEYGSLREGLPGRGRKEPADGPDDVVGLLITDGIGCGLVLNGNLYRGAHGAAGEFWGGESNAWVATNKAISAYAKEHELTFAEVFTAAGEGRREPRKLVHMYAADVAELLSGLLVLDPPVVVIGGDIVNAGDVFMDALRSALKPHLPPGTEIVYSDLGAECLRSGAFQMACDWLEAELFRV